MKCVGVVRYKRPHWTYIGRYDGGCGVKCSWSPDVSRTSLGAGRMSGRPGGVKDDGYRPGTRWLCTVHTT